MWRRTLLLCALLTLLPAGMPLPGPAIAAPALAPTAHPAAQTANAPYQLRYVANSGSDQGNLCLDPNLPCATIQHAVDMALPGDEIRIAVGVYTAPEVSIPESPQTVAYIAKSLRLQGGYLAGDWTLPVANNITLLDGQERARGLMIVGRNDTASPLAVSIADLWITNGKAQPELDAPDQPAAGGGVLIRGATVSIASSHIYSNSAQLGAGLAAFDAQLKISASLFERNRASGIESALGGGIYLQRGQAALDSSAICDNQAAGSEYSAGAGLALAGGSLTLQENVVCRNVAVSQTAHGAGLALSGEAITLRGNHIHHNSASGEVGSQGGGLAITLLNPSPANTASTQLSNNTIEHNTASVEQGSAEGGGLYLTGSASSTSTVGLHGDALLYNSATNFNFDGAAPGEATGGGAAIFDTNLVAFGVAVAYNRASGSYDTAVSGGGIAANGGTLRLSDSWFAGNQAQSDTGSVRGGGLSLLNVVLGLSSSVVADNSVLGGQAEGGAWYQRDGRVSAVNTAIIGNESNGSGAGIAAAGTSADEPTLSLIHATLNGSGAGAGLYLSSGRARIVNTIVVSHEVGLSAEAGAAIQGTALLWFNNTLNTDGAGSIVVDAEYSGDPRFAEDRVHLLAGSAAIDQGIDAGISLDIDGEARPQLGGFDIGADELLPKIELTKTVSSQVWNGTPLEYTLRISASDGPLTVVLSDSLPTGLRYVEGSVTGGASYDATTRQIVFAGEVEPDSPRLITYRATVDPNVAPGSILYNYAVLEAAGQRLERSAAVVVPDTSERHSLVLLYTSGDGSGAQSLADEMLTLLNNAELAAGNPYATVLALIDGPGVNDAYVYRLQQDDDPNCPNYENPTCNGRYVVGETIWPWSDAVGNPDSLSEFLKAALLAFPETDQVLLSLAGHGGSWTPELASGGATRHAGYPGLPSRRKGLEGGLLYDSQPGESLSTPELSLALASATAAAGRKIDLLFLDACFMAIAEVAHSLRASVDYILASQNWKWAVFPYDEHIAIIDGELSAAEIGETWLEIESAILRDEGYPFTYSLLATQEIDQVRSALDGLAATLIPALPAFRPTIAEAFAATGCFDDNQDGALSAEDTACDLDSFAAELTTRFGAIDSPVASAITAAAQKLRTAVAAVVLRETHLNGSPWIFPEQHWAWGELGGLSAFTPLGRDNWKRRYYRQDQLSFAANNRWGAFLAAWWNNAEPPPDPLCPPAGCPPPPGPLPISAEGDLFGFARGLWSVPVAPRAGEQATIGQVVFREGGKLALQNVGVRFYVANANGTSQLLGDGTVPLLPPRGQGSTTPVNWTPPAPGTYLLYALIDPDNRVRETNEGNNLVVRRINVLPQRPDRTPPVVDSFSINDGASVTQNRAVKLKVAASDPQPGSGVGWIYVVEFVPTPSGIWVPVQVSGWLPYSGTPSRYDWRLTDLPGAHYLQVWAADRAGNISRYPASAAINYTPQGEQVGRGESRFYLLFAQAGQRVRVRVEPLSGDPDLYVWSLDPFRPPWVSNQRSGVDEVSFNAPISGVYFVEVYGYTAASYRISMNVSTGRTATQEAVETAQSDASKPERARSLLADSALPGDSFDLPAAPNAGPLHLPLLLR